MIVVSSNEDDWRVSTFCNEPLGELDAGHGAKLDVEHQAAELRMLCIREERLR